MQNISWNLFSATGNIHAYLLYKDYERMGLEVDNESELSMNTEEHEEYSNL